ncbi:PepSY-associated TM helix domain-containing protein [Novosphingobium sp. NPDC080210]|uniref:PepSY-associated TM helix domain-containing protein n=1 Tax=Novosphingobium sp. NPDC080210 TaxID=3390596 RepID=UPI003CFD71E4
MRTIELLHRWGGGLLGLILAVLGLTGAILVYKETWIALPHVDDARVVDPAALGQLTARLLKDASGGESLIYANDRFGLVQFRSGNGGFYAAQSGEIVERWSSQWERPELWLFDLHHYLLAGETGKFLAGIAGLAAIVFVVTGVILWWRTRRTFRLRLWPKRLSQPAVRMHHRDLGIVTAPILFLAALTGVMLIFRPVAHVVLAPMGSTATLDEELQSPVFKSAPLASHPDWPAIVERAHRTFPDAAIRIVALPRKAGEPITVRMKRGEEWLPNGRTMVWFDAGSGLILGSRDAGALSPVTQAFNAIYPLHAAKVGGFAYRFLLCIAGIAMAMLGSLAVWSFWMPRRS